MSPRHFTNANKIPLSKDVSKAIADQPNLWYAFTAITGIAKLFSYTPPQIKDNPNKDK
jgi:hypothetical protein